MDNYVMINGTKYEIDSSDKIRDIKKLFGIANPFGHRDEDDQYWLINVGDEASSNIDIHESEDDNNYDNCNYFSSEKAAEQVALHQLLYRKLLKYAYDNDVIDRQDWNGSNYHYYILKCNYSDTMPFTKEYVVSCDTTHCTDNVYFATNDAACHAIDEVVIPFIVNHPEFTWGKLNLSE